ncbi:hypothetical protein [Nocardia sp. NPDC127526]|uniref:hypothetical protein n=1 Tax=Nocardia sp. NPDC127526 TaxID=3345393 RepID=UPI003640F5E1
MSSGTIAVGVAAIVVSSIFNFVTLKRSGKTLELAQDTYQRTEERYRADRVEAHRDTLRAAIVDLAHHVTVWEHLGSYFATVLKVHASDVAATAPDIKLLRDRATIVKHDVEKQRPALNDVLRAARMAMLLSDETTKALVAEIAGTLRNVTPTVNTIDYDDPESMRAVATRLDEIRAQAAEQVSALLTHAGNALAYKELET